MREIRTYGSEGGEAQAFPTPIVNSISYRIPPRISAQQTTGRQLLAQPPRINLNRHKASLAGGAVDGGGRKSF